MTERVVCHRLDVNHQLRIAQTILSHKLAVVTEVARKESDVRAEDFPGRMVHELNVVRILEDESLNDRVQSIILIEFL